MPSQPNVAKPTISIDLEADDIKLMISDWEIPHSAVLGLSIALDKQLAAKLPAIEKFHYSHGVRAFFDGMAMFRVNHWHQDPVVNRDMQHENDLIEDWCILILKRLDEPLYQEWISYNEAYNEGFTAGVNSRDIKDV